MKQAINFLPRFICTYCGQNGAIYLYRHTTSEPDACYSVECSHCMTSSGIYDSVEKAIDAYRNKHFRGWYPGVYNDETAFKAWQDGLQNPDVPPEIPI